MEKVKKPLCKNCSHMWQGTRAKANGNNIHTGGPRAPCYCGHPDAYETFQRVCPRSNRLAGFIAYTQCGKNGPNIKTSPTWCPLREKNKKEAAEHDNG